MDLAGGAVFHAGPVMRKVGDQWELIVIGPTSSIRMEPHAKMVGELGVKLIIGKGGMAQDSQAMFKLHKQAYLQAAPGCACRSPPASGGWPPATGPRTACPRPCGCWTWNGWDRSS